MHRETWSEVRIGDLGEVFTGRTPPTNHPAYFGDDYPFITPGDMHHGKYARATERGISLEGAALLKRIKIPANSICVSCIGWQMGEVIMTTQPSFTNQQINTIVPNGKVESSFLYYSLRPRKQELLSLGSATGVRTPILNKSAFCDLKVKIPPLSIQQWIAGILSAYDDLIENNTRRIKILEQMAQMPYREWFVNCRFPGYQKLRFVNSEVGCIPTGWGVRPLGSAIELVRNSAVAGPHLGNLEYVPIECLPMRSLALAESKPPTEAQSSLFTFREGDVLFGAMRSYFHKVVIAPFDGITRSTCFILRPKRQIDYSWAVMTLFEEKTVEYSNNHARGTTIPYAVWDGSLAAMPVPVPPDELLSEFEDRIRPLLKRIQLSFFAQRNLRQTRDLLIPKLMSGEISVEEVDSEAVTQRV